MNNSKNSLADRRGATAATVQAVICLAVIGGHPLNAESLQGPDDGRGVLRYDPIVGKLVPISPEKPNVGASKPRPSWWWDRWLDCATDWGGSKQDLCSENGYS